MSSSSRYGNATRHPWASVAFVLPLLVVYEVGLAFLQPPAGGSLRNGADTWLRWLLGHIGLAQSFWPGVFLALALVGWAWWKRASRPPDLLNVWSGMVIESILFAAMLWLASRAVGQWIDGNGWPLAAGEEESVCGRLIGYLGAGIYEEALFRLVLFAGLRYLFVLAEVPQASAFGLAAVISSLLFSLAHHIGPAGEVLTGYVFLFRTVAGMYFCLVYAFRGFGIAVGAHAAYDVMVGMALYIPIR